MANLDYLRREKISLRNRQFLTSYEWDFLIDFSNYKFYHPDMEMLHLQGKSISNVNAMLSGNPIEVKIRGFTIHQPGMNDNSQNSDFTLNLIDFEDQSIKYWLLDWMNKCDSITTHTGYRREDLMVDAYVWRLNSNLEHVYEWHYINCLPKSPTYAETMDDNKNAIGGDVSIQFDGEICIPTPLTQPLA